jgi:small subunit ribosomal protein S3
MGQKVHPHGFRLGFNKTWRSRWYADKDYAKLLHEDLKLRDTLKARFAHAGVSKIEIERAGQQAEDRHLHLAPGHHHRPQGDRRSTS